MVIPLVATPSGTDELRKADSIAVVVEVLTLAKVTTVVAGVFFFLGIPDVSPVAFLFGLLLRPIPIIF